MDGPVLQVYMLICIFIIKTFKHENIALLIDIIYCTLYKIYLIILKVGNGLNSKTITYPCCYKWWSETCSTVYDQIKTEIIVYFAQCVCDCGVYDMFTPVLQRVVHLLKRFYCVKARNSGSFSYWNVIPVL